MSLALNAVRQISTATKLTGRSGKTDRTLEPQCLVEYSKGPNPFFLYRTLRKTNRTLEPQRPGEYSKGQKPVFLDRTRPVHLGQTQPSVRWYTLATVPPSQRNRTQVVSVRCIQIQRPVT